MGQDQAAAAAAGAFGAGFPGAYHFQTSNFFDFRIKLRE